MLRNATPLRKSTGWSPNISDQHVSCIALAHEMHLCRSPSKMSHACHRPWRCYKTLMFSSLLAGCKIPCACHTKRRFNVQKWREHVLFLAFWIRNVLRATTLCTCSTVQLPKVVWHPPLFTLTLTSTCKCASSLSRVQFFNIPTSKSGPNLVCLVHFTKSASRRTRRPSEPTFSTLRSHKSLENMEKYTVSRLFYLFAALHLSFFWLFLFSDLLSSSLLFSDSSQLCFSICPYCRKFDF